MELEKIVNDTRDIANRIFSPEILGPWDPSSLMADIVGETGTLAQSILTQEGIAAAPPETAHLTRDIPRLLFMLVNLSNHYNIDLPRSWDDLMQEGHANIARLENKE